MCGYDGALATLIKLWTTSTSKNLHDVQYTEIHQSTTFSIIDLSALLSTHTKIKTGYE